MGEVAVSYPMDLDQVVLNRHVHSRSFCINNDAPESFAIVPTVEDIIRQKIYQEDIEEAFFVVDVGSIIRQHKKWTENLSRVEPHYAIKCNTDPQVLRTLLPLCSGFDCASKGEIATMLSLGVSPNNIIFANPCKAPAHIRYARDHGVHCMTFDNADELRKVSAINPNAKMVLRILTDDSKSICRFGTKFGAHMHNTYGLLQTAKELGVDVIGVSFHVGSGCQDAMAYDDAVRRARRVFNEAISLGFTMELLDVGGGFPGTDDFTGQNISFEEIAAVLSKALDEHFPSRDVRIIAEPGRYYAAGAFNLCVNVTSKRVIQKEVAPVDKLAMDAPIPKAEGGKSVMYYVNDGVYGSFNSLLFDHAIVEPRVLCVGGNFMYNSQQVEDMPTYESSIWGPTCDSMDCITKTARLPEMEIGDWLYFENMGAYTVAAASQFNGFNLSRVFYTNSELENAKTEIYSP